MQVDIEDQMLIEIGTFLARRWSNNKDVTLEFSFKNETRMKKNKIILVSIKKLKGNDFAKYRQFRVALWYESMRLKFCKKILSNDHAFGFILNTLETRRIEILGKKIWAGMNKELIFNYAYWQNYRPQLDSVYGRTRIVEGFYQYFLFRDIKGDISTNKFERIIEAGEFAHKVVDEAIKKEYDTVWLEKKIPKIIKMLDIDSLLTIPIALPWTRPNMALTEEELLKALNKIIKNRESDFGQVDPKAIMLDKNIKQEYKSIMNENKKNGITTESINVHIPAITNIDETIIYDLDLIAKLKTKFKYLRSEWKEEYYTTGDEFDIESYIEGHASFFMDAKKTIKTEIIIMLDHSSSIAGDQLEYKKATLALCEVLSYLKVKFAVYAFSTVNKAVVCWSIKSDTQRWNVICAKRLAQIVANGSTPLAEVYDKMYPILYSKRPKIFLTLTDGEPSDARSVRNIIRTIKSMGIRMVALGLGKDTIRATTITSNLKYLGYKRALAVSRLNNIPNKVLEILGES